MNYKKEFVIPKPEIKDISGFIKKLKTLIKEKDFEYYFRGHAEKVEGEILPRIYRTKTTKKTVIIESKKFGTKEINKKLIDNEHFIFKEMIIHSPQDFINEFTTIEKMVKMQHCNLPTRLIDITSNPLVALYFSCLGRTNGEVVIFKVPKDEIKYYDSDTVSILANLAKMKPQYKFGNKADNLYLIHEIRNEKAQFSDGIKPVDFNRVLALKVKLNNQRIFRQSGAFLLYGINKLKRDEFYNKGIPANINPDWIVDKIEIDYLVKKRLSEDLLSLGIHESYLFPEIEFQAKQIIETYQYIE